MKESNNLYPTILRNDITNQIKEDYASRITGDDTTDGWELYRVGSEVVFIVCEGEDAPIHVSDECIKDGVLTKDLLEHAYSLIGISGLVNKNMRTFDPAIFDNCNNLRECSMFYTSVGNTIDTIPEDMFESKILSAANPSDNLLVVDCSAMFRNCTEISHVPDSIYKFFHDVEMEGVNYELYSFIDSDEEVGEIKVSDLPVGLFEGLKNVLRLTDVLPHMSKVTTIPEGFFNGIVPGTADDFINLHWAFSYNNHISDIPQNLFDPLRGLEQKISMSDMFSNCTGLKSIPDGLFDGLKNVLNFSAMFFNCTELTGEAPRLWEMFPDAEGASCFEGCTGLTNYDEIPNHWK